MEPRNFKEVSKNPKWVVTTQNEYDALHANDTWEEVPYVPGMNILGCKWVYKTKLKSNGTLERFKSRLVAKGYDQVDSVDFEDTFNPVVKATAIRCVLSIVEQ